MIFLILQKEYEKAYVFHVSLFFWVKIYPTELFFQVVLFVQKYITEGIG